MERSTQARIGYVVKVYPRFSETFIVTELLAREAAGEDITIFALQRSDDPRFHPELARVAAEVNYAPQTTRPSALWDVLREAARLPSLSSAIGRELDELLAVEVDDAVQAVWLAQRVIVDGITHLHAHFATSATTVARLASRLTGVPYSFTAHAKDLFHESVQTEHLRGKVAGASYVATVSAYNVRYLEGLLPELVERIHLVHNGLELDRFPFRRPTTPGETLRLVAVGRLVEKKGFEVLIDAVALLRHRGVRVTLELAGGGERAESLAERVRARGLEDVVDLLGPIPQDEVARLLRSADAFVVPCVVGEDGNVDGLPTVLLEAMAVGVPCVSTSVTGIPEVVIDGETGLLCEPGDIAALADTIMRLTDGSVDTAALALGARALVERQFDSGRLAAHLRELTDAASADGRVTRARRSHAVVGGPLGDESRHLPEGKETRGVGRLNA
ncbi:colanic acid biosynthesis glycosyltransferase WcaL [Labedella endophytica]|uniref:Colanic acid biosynthesis glycosyltransferase WcaL n=1 Tax=Labedella endophytica TaxID=1523160 RepID=A0A3S0XKW1_9MICO|nr:colanic acid biosynthesis glycosyltransferase WcaL [Labedella endophytica]